MKLSLVIALVALLGTVQCMSLSRVAVDPTPAPTASPTASPTAPPTPIPTFEPKVEPAPDSPIMQTSDWLHAVVLGPDEVPPQLPGAEEGSEDYGDEQYDGDYGSGYDGSDGSSYTGSGSGYDNDDGDIADVKDAVIGLSAQLDSLANAVAGTNARIAALSDGSDAGSDAGSAVATDGPFQEEGDDDFEADGSVFEATTAAAIEDDGSAFEDGSDEVDGSAA